MKKFFAVLMVGVLAMCATIVEEQPAQAQVVVSNRCCDSAGNIRCVLGAFYPVGNGCFCYGQGYGWVC